MVRKDLINKVIAAGSFNHYLEIGAFKGDSFLPVICKNKIAVDPHFRIPLKKKIFWWWKNRKNIRNKYYQMPSDDFFLKKNKKIESQQGLEVVFVDGLHTFEASLNDVLNSLQYLKKNGVIIVHDCYPPNKASATPAVSFEQAENMKIEGWTTEWCGDVWKTIVYLKEQYKDQLEISVLNCDYGLGVISTKDCENLDLMINKDLLGKIKNLQFEHLSSNPYELINLKDRTYAASLLREIAEKKNL